MDTAKKAPNCKLLKKNGSIFLLNIPNPGRKKTDLNSTPEGSGFNEATHRTTSLLLSHLAPV